MESEMKRLIVSRNVGAALLVVGSIALATLMLVSSGQLNVATLQSIDGPLDAQQLASMQLSNLLNVGAGAMICGATFSAIVLLATRGRSKEDRITA